jgi:hypothetical protein
VRDRNTTECKAMVSSANYLRCVMITILPKMTNMRCSDSIVVHSVDFGPSQCSSRRRAINFFKLGREGGRLVAICAICEYSTGLEASKIESMLGISPHISAVVI